jgi:cobalamin biosynthesis protein CobC
MEYCTMTTQRISQKIEHGGRINAAQLLFPNAPLPWIDLSTGVNPRAYPIPEIAPQAWSRLPDDGAVSSIEDAARVRYNAPSQARVVAGAGVQSFIQILPHIFPRRRVAILGFTYAEYALTWSASGSAIEIIDTIEQLDQDFDIGIIVNPNNPDGRLVEKDRIIDLAQRFARKNQLLIIDESFVDFYPQLSAVELSILDSVIVLRSFGKTYGLPGLRLGFALCSKYNEILLRKALGPWAVSGPALAIGLKALSDLEWVNCAAVQCRHDAERLDDLLKNTGFSSIGGTMLYRLVQHGEAQRIFDKLCAHGILVRRFPEKQDWLRFGLPDDSKAWVRLTAALEAA